MRRFLVTWAFNVAALYIAAWIFSGIDYGGNDWALVGAGLVFSLANIFVKPIVTILAIPVIIITLGLALFFINMLMLYLTSWIVDDFTIDNFGAAVGGTIIVWLVNAGLEAGFGGLRRDEA
jgi:putative membrane protein